MDNAKELAIKTKCQKDYPDFTDVVDGMQSEGIKAKLMLYANYREENKLAQSKDEALQRAKDVVAELNGPYADAEKSLKLKLAYLHVLLNEKGGDVQEEG